MPTLTFNSILLLFARVNINTFQPSRSEGFKKTHTGKNVETLGVG